MPRALHPTTAHRLLPPFLCRLILKGAIMIGAGLFLYTQVQSACGAFSGDCTAKYGPLVFVALGLLYWLWLFCARSRIELTAALLEQAVKVIAAHPGLIVSSLFFLCVKLLFMVLGLAGIVLLFASQVTVIPPAAGSTTCILEWKHATADYIMYGIVTLFLGWSVILWMNVRYYVVSLTTGCWYYSNQSLAAQEGAQEGSKEYIARYPICYSTKLALTKSFGTIAFASLIMWVCEQLRRMANRQARNNGLIGCLIACCISCILAYLEFLTRFALTFHALTGDDFCASGRTFFGHLERHGLGKVLVVDWMATIVLKFGAFVIGLLCAFATVVVAAKSTAIHDDDRVAVMATLGVISWLVASLILLFLAEILHDVVDASYACLVLDLDHRQVTGTFHQPALAGAVLAKVQPTAGLVIAQPGGLAYAQPAQPMAPGQVVVGVQP